MLRITKNVKARIQMCVIQAVTNKASGTGLIVVLSEIIMLDLKYAL